MLIEAGLDSVAYLDSNESREIICKFTIGRFRVACGWGGKGCLRDGSDLSFPVLDTIKLWRIFQAAEAGLGAPGTLIKVFPSGAKARDPITRSAARLNSLVKKSFLKWRRKTGRPWDALGTIREHRVMIFHHQN
jgi:hypothetical protein